MTGVVFRSAELRHTFRLEMLQPGDRRAKRPAQWSTWIGVSGGDLPATLSDGTVSIKVAVSDGRLRCVGLRIEPPQGIEVSAVDVRGVLVGSILEDIRHMLQLLERSSDDRPDSPARLLAALYGEAVEPAELPPLRRGRKGLDAFTVREAAELYNELRPQFRTIGETYVELGKRLHVVDAQARRRVKRAWQQFPELRLPDERSTFGRSRKSGQS